MRGLMVEWPMVSLVALSEAAGLNDTNVRTRIARIYGFIEFSSPPSVSISAIIEHGRRVRRCSHPEVFRCRVRSDSTLPAGTPVIGIRYFIDGPPLHRAELVLGITDRHQRIGRYIVRYSQQSLHFALATDVIRGDQRAEAEGAACADDILHSGIDTGAANPVSVDKLLLVDCLHLRRQHLARGRRAVSEAGHQEHRRLSHVLPQIGAG